MRLAGKLLLALFSAVAFVGALELAARTLGLEAGPFLVPTEENCMRRSGSLQLEFRPHCTGDSRGTTVHTNALGLRGPEVRDDGSTRILALGDSCTWGWRVADNESYPAVLQALLDQVTRPGRYQVINAGTPGYTSYQGLVYLRERGLALQPQTVIIAFGFNDAARTGDVEVRIAQGQRLLPLLELDDFLLQQSTLYRWSRSQLQTAAQQNLPAQVTPEKFRQNLTEMIRLARAQGARVLLLSFAQRGGLQTLYLDALAQVAMAENVAYLPYEGPRIDLVHPTPGGYRAFVDRLFERLMAEGSVVPP